MDFSLDASLSSAVRCGYLDYHPLFRENRQVEMVTTESSDPRGYTDFGTSRGQVRSGDVVYAPTP